MTWHSEVYVEDIVPAIKSPSRSRLFALEPIGVGTADCEGLISYLIRLAKAHSVEARLLIRTEFERHCCNLGGLRYANFFSGNARTLHGTGVYAKSFVNASEILTTRNDMSLLTMLPWRGVVPPIGNGLIARHPKWCNMCLRDLRESRHGAYFPLSWYLELNTACPRHNMKLSDRCPWCRTQQPFFPYAPYLDRCAYCNGWLGTKGHLVPSIAPEDWELWLAVAIGNMIAHNPDARKYVSGEAFRNILAGLVEEHTGGEKGTFSLAMGMTKTTMSCWITKNQKPLFPQFLKLCHQLGKMPSELFQMQSRSLLPLNEGISLPARLHKIVDKFGLRMQKKHAIGQALKKVLSDPDDYRSVREIATDLGTTRAYLNYWFRASCLEISSRHKKHTISLARQKRAIQRNEVRIATLRIYCSGTYPSVRKVQQAINPLKLSLQIQELRASRKQTLKDIQG